MSIARRILLSLVLLATTALLGACLPGGGNARAPIPQALIPAGTPATRLVVVLPGRGDDIAALRTSGIVPAVQSAWPDADVLLTGLGFAYYMEGRARNACMRKWYRLPASVDIAKCGCWGRRWAAWAA